MPQDHFVAQTYLRQFVAPGQQLRGYRKTTLRNFPCWPRDICRELDGDVIPDFLSNPRQLGQYRSLFEPHWASAVAALADRSDDREIKLAISGYGANLMVTTPAMTRTFVEASDHSHVARLVAEVTLRDEHNQPVEDYLRKAVEWFRAGKIVIKTERDFIRGMLTRHLMSHAWNLYNGDWIVIRNTTAVDFVTSDNPAAFEDQGPFRGGRVSLPRYIPLSPRLCLRVDMGVHARDEEPDFSQPPQGRIRFATTSEERIRHINQIIIQCAEDLVISSSANDEIETMVRRFATYRVANEFMDFRTPDGSFINGHRLRVWDPAANDQNWTFPFAEGAA